MSEIALRLIAENKKVKAKSLDLGNCGLIEIPLELTQLVWLEELILSNKYSVFNKQKGIWETRQNQIGGKPNRIQSVEGLEKITKLKKLIVAKDYSDSFGEWELKDLSPLADLTNLQHINCLSTQVNDLTPLARLTNLQYLQFQNTQVNDLTPLARLTNLQDFSCGHTRVSDLSPLEELTKLETLAFQATEVDNLMGIKKLTALKSLYFNSNAIHDIDLLAGLLDLEVLDLSYTKVSNLAPISRLLKLKILNCSHSSVSDISNISELVNLQEVHFTSIPIRDLKPLQKLNELKNIWFYDTIISDLSPIASLDKLESLVFFRTKVTNLSPLKKLVNLKELDCMGNKISDLSPLKEMINLEYLNCSNTQVSDLSPLNRLLNLKRLNCNETQIKDLSPLADLKNLQTFSCAGTQVSDLTPLFERIKEGVRVRWNSWSYGGFYLNNCPFTNPPIEIIKEGNEAIIDYFEKKNRPLKIFISYSKHDHIQLDAMLRYLNPLIRGGWIQTWDDNQIKPGEEWDELIKTKLREAEVIFLLVSPHSLNTDYIWNVEIEAAMRRHNEGSAKVIPIILSKCLWTEKDRMGKYIFPPAKLNALPFKGKPIDEWERSNDAWDAIASGIKTILEELR